MTLLLCWLTLHGICAAADTHWDFKGRLRGSYDYARSTIGFQLRQAGWKCKEGFVIGQNNEQEHSLWKRNGETLQLMIWRTQLGVTSFSYTRLTEHDNDKKKLSVTPRPVFPPHFQKKFLNP